MTGLTATPPPVPLAVANAAAGQARRTRAEALLSVATEMLTTTDVIKEAATDPTGALLQIRLHQLLQAQDGWGQGRALRVIHRTLAVLGEPVSERAEILAIKLSWLLDSRTGGNRLAAYCDVLMEHKQEAPPWPGFPHLAAPVKLQGERA
ncbi:hypothetical protein GCG21_09050 [Pseudactinotalea sp. HY160]|uniref:hypothetical protein n=1 Tax=Pseudactinotalea sp. HY160 TaxID=2654490 RepID=UPI00128D5977|nr:hypothetical protein [Pseudactinotalea sp. HY160]MPV50149.1 hypothetical protein [Pseudactinotalea sp. HY160]